MDYAPYIRIFIRYVVGIVVGADTADLMAGDPELITVLALFVGMAVEAFYVAARKYGWAK